MRSPTSASPCVAVSSTSTALCQNRLTFLLIGQACPGMSVLEMSPAKLSRTMTGLYARWMDQWERKLAMRDTNRVVRPFDWGTDWLNSIGFPPCPAEVNGNAAACVSQFVAGALADSDRFFSYDPPRDYRLDGSHLTFTSPVVTPYPENNTVHAEWFPAEKANGRALVVLPQWNSGP